MTLGEALDRYRDTIIRPKGKPEAAERDEYALAVVNRYLALLKAALRKAHSEWGALPVVPPIRLLKLNNARYRWLTDEEESYLAEMTAIAERRLN